MTPQVESGTSILERVNDLFARAGDSFSHAIAKMTSTTQNAADTLADKAIAPLTSTPATFFQRWLQAHPTIERLLHILNWAADRPMTSLILLLFLIAIAWSLIKSIGRLFENFWLLVLKIPFKLGYFLLRFVWRSLNKLSPRFIPKSPRNQIQQMQILPFSNAQFDRTERQQRLLEIATQLAVLNQEQNRLMQEALAILGSTQVAPEEIPDVFQQKVFSKVDGGRLRN
jgi:hypothetical protein